MGKFEREWQAILERAEKSIRTQLEIARRVDRIVAANPDLPPGYLGIPPVPGGFSMTYDIWPRNGHPFSAEDRDRIRRAFGVPYMERHFTNATGMFTWSGVSNTVPGLLLNIHDVEAPHCTVEKRTRTITIEEYVATCQEVSSDATGREL